MRLHNIFILLAVMVLTLIEVQQSEAASKVIAAILSSDQSRYREAHSSFVKSLAAQGYDKKNTEIILQTPNPDTLSWSNAVRRFNAYKPDLIVAYGAGAASAALKEAYNIPVVIIDVYGIEKNGKAGCGVSSRVPMLTLLKAANEVKKMHSILIIATFKEPGSHQQSEDLKRNAKQFGINAVEANLTSASSIDTALNSLLQKVDAVFVTESSVAAKNFEKIVAKSAAKSIPLFSTMPGGGEKGATISLEIAPQEQGNLGAEMAVRILEGANPQKLPLLTPKSVELVVNMKAAKKAGLTVPFSLLGSATKVIK